jgi:hypothetical protein
MKYQEKIQFGNFCILDSSSLFFGDLKLLTLLIYL